MWPLAKWNDWINFSTLRQKTNITAQFSLDIIMIQYWVLLLACLSVSDHTHMNGLNQIGVSADLKHFKRVYSSMSRHVQSCSKQWVNYILGKSWGMKLNHCTKMKFSIKDFFSKSLQWFLHIYWINL